MRIRVAFALVALAGCHTTAPDSGDLAVPPDLAAPPDAAAPPSCTDGIKNGGEADVDCGGACPSKCGVGKMCGGPADCGTGVCKGGVCVDASCSDGVKNGSETDVDCGGSCPRCGDGKICNGPVDCGSGVCTGGTCAAPTCMDAVKNGGETDVDCGGSCPKCATGKKCATGADCATGACKAGLCAPCTVDGDCAGGLACHTLDGQCASGLGCATNARRGFYDPKVYPTIALCGANAAYDVAANGAAATCAQGWHMCTPADVNKLVNLPAPSTDNNIYGWVKFVDPTQMLYGDYPMPACGGVTPAVANLQGTAPCTNSGVFPEGWRLAINAATWGLSHKTGDQTTPCVEHTQHACGFGGGMVPLAASATLCCM